MRNIYVISDTHFQHTNILDFEDARGVKFRGRLFSSTEEMDEKIVANWNAVVTSDSDVVYHLGDVYFGDSKRADWLLSRLRGRKRLILGNHDTGKDPVLLKHFQKIYMWRMFKEFDLVLTHVPIHPENFRKVAHNVHGHNHQNPSYRSSGNAHYHNVCVEHTNYSPIDIETARRY